MFKKIIAIIAGYAIFAVSAVIHFKVSGHDPHSDPTITFAILTAINGAAFSFVGGLVAQAIAQTTELTINYVLAFIMAGFALFSLLKTGGNHWTQILAIFIFAPLSILGGLFYLKRKQKQGI